MCGVSRRRWCSRIPEKYRSCNEPTMSSVQCLREFVNERLTAAAEEIFGVFEKTIVEYEQEIDRQRRLLDIVWKPEIKLHRTELPQQHVCKEEEVLPDQQLWNQERNSSVDQEDPEPPQIKEEQEQLCSSQEGEQLVVKQETDTFMWTPTNEDSDQSEAEPHSDQQLLSHSSPAAESQDQTGSQPVESGSARNAETKPKKRRRKNTSHGNNDVDKSLMSDDAHTGKRILICDTCGKTFQSKYSLEVHVRIHTGERPYSCTTCGKRFKQRSQLNIHLRIHTDEKPYSCNTCGRAFKYSNVLSDHIKTHTREMLYSCNICAKKFSIKSYLKRHTKIHTGKKLSSCKTCNKCFPCRSALLLHVRTHTGDKSRTKRNSSVDQEDPEPPQIKEEQEQLCSSQEGEQLVVKQETDTFMWTPTNEDSDQSEAKPHSDQQLLSHSSPAAESQDQTGSQPVESGSARNAETKPKKRCHQNTSHSNNDVDQSLMSGDAHTGKGTFLCDTCGKDFKCKYNLDRHLRSYTGERPYSCDTCGKRFKQKSHLSAHLRIHTGERPYCCGTCGKHFIGSGALSAHMRIHTREKLYPCTTCGKKLSTMSTLMRHMRRHTLYSCKICMKSFICRSNLKFHENSHR
ncbi:zinc finger protein 2 homolog isoform X2 [Mastacembelus armatus]|uniref:zinc finger protein 2 homolog isoform X2 n=1 Tax=Mastacembelus armatus TaxID=205130 RepID=UPI001436990C|nr:zinc finger protein 2 homolog isoform X2 [Mastacembelus armatus]